MYDKNTTIKQIYKDFPYGYMMFPVNKNYFSGNTLGTLRLTWYSHIDANKTVEIMNYFKEESEKRDIFYPIYNDEEIRRQPDKALTGIFFFKGEKNKPVAFCNAGGGFAYVGAMHDSFPHALELSKKGYNAFALIYRPGWNTAMEDLARAIQFVYDHHVELGVSMENYSLWGGSAGARMAATLGDYTPSYFGEHYSIQPAAVIMQYTGYSQVSGLEPPTYNCVGTNDYIADYHTMERRIMRIKNNGTDAMIDVYPGLSHGFGLGKHTIANGWIENAVKFWERNMK